MSNVIPVPEGAPEFVFKDVEGGPGTIKGVAKLDPYLVSYVDQEGKDQVRIAFRVPGSNSTFLLQETIQGAKVATVAYSWFHKIFVDRIRADELEDDIAGETVSSV